MRRIAGVLVLLSLIASPVCMSRESETALIKAVRSGKVERVVKQLDKGGNDFEAFYKDDTAMFLALRTGRLDLADLLASRGARVTQIVNNPDRDPKSNELNQLSYLGWAVEKGRTDSVKWLLEKGANPFGGQSSRRRSSLHMAAELGNVEMVRLILASKITPGVTDVFNDTPLHVAAQYGKAEVAQLLLSAGAPVNARADTGVTPLMEVFRSRGVPEADRLATAKVLIDAGADVNASADYVGPALFEFVRVDSKGNLQVDDKPFAREAADYLLSHGATFAAVSAWGVRHDKLTAQDAAAMARYEAEQKQAALDREREREAARAASATGAAAGAAGSGTCTQRSMRWVAGREQLRGHYEFFDVKVPCVGR